MPIIEIKKLGVIFTSVKETVALHDFNLDIEEQAFFSIIRPSGCGKTTVLRVLGGSAHPSSGEVLINGEIVAQKENAKTKTKLRGKRTLMEKSSISI